MAGKSNVEQDILAGRIRHVRRRLKKLGVDCLIVTKEANTTYITGFSGQDSWSIITPRGVYLLTDSRYIEQAHNQCPQCRKIARTGPMVDAAAGLLGRFKSVKVAAVEDLCSIGSFNSLRRKLPCSLRSVGGVVEEIRAIKDNAEISAIKRAIHIGAKSLEKVLRKPRPGVTESEVAAELDYQIRKLGAANSFETIVAFGANASQPHYQRANAKLKKNDTVLVDFGVRYEGYCCDLTRCFSVGKTSELYKKAYEAVKKAKAAAIEMIRPGVEMSKVDAVSRKVIKESSLAVYGHGTGHGLGLEVHEKPVISAKSKEKFAEGMVFTIEPGIYIPGKLGVRLEDDVVVTKRGCEVLSRFCP